GRGDFLINVSLEVSSVALIKLCWEKGAMYLDTCIEPWPGGYTDPTVPAARRTNYALREEALALRAGNARAPTAVLTHGANPGLDLPHAARRRYPRAHLDAARRAFSRLLHHARRVDLHRRLLHGARGLAGGISADGALRLPPVRRRGHVDSRARRAQLRAAGA